MDDPDRHEHMRALAGRIRMHLAKKGWTQAQLEEAAYFPQGALSRILAARQMKIWPKTLHRIAKALGVPPEELSEGVGGEPVPAAGSELAPPPALEDIAGYANAEIQVARLEPHVPIEVFEQARKTRFASPPPTITVAFLRAHISFLSEHIFGLGKVSGTRVRQPANLEKSEPEKRAARPRK